MSIKDITILGNSSQQPTRHRNHGAYLVRWNGEGLLFDPGEGTQRQFIHANIAPPVVTKIFISHFHGDHCLGLGSMLMRLNLDKVQHEIHCYYPASGKKYFDRLRYGTIYHDNINVVEYPVSKEGLVDCDENFKIEALFLDHGVDDIGWRITEHDRRKFNKEKLKEYGIKGVMVKKLIQQGYLEINDTHITLDDVSWIRKGETFAVVIDTRLCENAVKTALNAKVLLCESTYLSEHEEMAHKNYHLTAKQAALIAKEANVEKLILTHFSARYPDLSEFKKEAVEFFENSEIAEEFKKFNF